MALPAKWLLSIPPIERFLDFSSNAIREAILGALRQGPIPQHVAFVMDGNRRYARGLKKEVIEGHSAGFETLGRVCLHVKSESEAYKHRCWRFAIK